MKIKYQILKIKNKISNIKNKKQRFKIGNKTIKFCVLTCIFDILFLIFDFSSAYAWKLPIEVSTTADNGVKVYNKLVIGIESDATDGFDNLWDTPALVSHPDPDNPVLLRAYINNKNSAREDTKYLWKDLRGPTTGGNTVWDITVESVPRGRSVVLIWDVPHGVLNPGERLVLRDNDRIGSDGEPLQVDTSQTSSYAFVSNGEESRSLSLVLLRESADDRHSGGGSGFGCGMVRPYRDETPDYGAAAMNIIVLFLPFVFVRLLRRLTHLRFSI